MTKDNRGVLIYGPKEGKLDIGLLSFNSSIIVSTKAKVRNFIAKIDICNPRPVEVFVESSWDFGFLFRSTGSSEYYRLYMQDGKSWYFDFAIAQKLLKPEVGNPLAHGSLTNFKKGKNDWNKIELRVEEGEAQFFVNEVFIATLDTSRKDVRGEVSIVNNFRGGTDAFKLKPVRFTDFCVWSLDSDSSNYHNQPNLAVGRRKLEFQEQGELVKKLLACPSLAGSSSRATLIALLPAQIRNSIQFSVQSTSSSEVFDLVRTCLNYPEGLERLLEIVRSFDAGTIPLADLEVYLANLNRLDY